MNSKWKDGWCFYISERFAHANWYFFQPLKRTTPYDRSSDCKFRPFSSRMAIIEPRKQRKDIRQSSDSSLQMRYISSFQIELNLLGIHTYIFAIIYSANKLKCFHYNKALALEFSSVLWNICLITSLLTLYILREHLHYFVVSFAIPFCSWLEKRSSCFEVRGSFSHWNIECGWRQSAKLHYTCLKVLKIKLFSQN